jgi:hypothetical protein
MKELTIWLAIALLCVSEAREARLGKDKPIRWYGVGSANHTPLDNWKKRLGNHSVHARCTALAGPKCG